MHVSKTQRRTTALGRYDLRDALPATDAFPLPRSRRRVSVATIAIQVPRPFDGSERGARQVASVNRRVDVLEVERSRYREDADGNCICGITDAAFLEGRQIQRVLERASRIGGSTWARDRVDAASSHDEMVAAAAERAIEANDLINWIKSTVGAYDTQIMLWVLRDRIGYMGIAGKTGPDTERRAGYVAQRFRDALLQIAEAKAATGKKPIGIRDSEAI